LVPPTGNVLDVLAQDKQFSTLIELIKIAGLGDTLQQDGPYTVFAPTNQVFGDIYNFCLQYRYDCN
jgi:uncharacterized surface protein with fasciclin (FAS1) repeats